MSKGIWSNFKKIRLSSSVVNHIGRVPQRWWYQLLHIPSCPVQLSPPAPTVIPIYLFGLNLKGAADKLLKLTVSCQNCNSLNLTTNINSYDIKIAALKTLNTDLIFLCDTRLVSNKGVNSAQRLKNSCRDARGRNYDVFANSNSNSRGVAMLAATELNLTAINTQIDLEENFIFVNSNYMGPAVGSHIWTKQHVRENFIFVNSHYMGHDLLLGAIYGPNSTSHDFYRRISHIIGQYTHCKIIIGGDWNTVWDNAPLNSNIDVYKMAALPNPKNSELLKNMALNYNLVDPFRVLHLSVNTILTLPRIKTQKPVQARLFCNIRQSFTFTPGL